MTDFFYELVIREHLRRLELLDRKLERWGWFRRHETTSGSPGWRFRAGTALVKVGIWLQGRADPQEGTGTCPVTTAPAAAVSGKGR